MAKTADDFFDAANVCEVHERWLEAIDNYDRAIELQPIFPEAYFNRAGDWEALENYENAIADYESAIAQSPTDPTGYESLAQLYMDANDPIVVNPKLAVRLARRACELSKFACFKKLRTLARACETAGRLREATKYQAKSVDLARTLQAMDVNCATYLLEKMDAEIMLPDLEAQLERYRYAKFDNQRTLAIRTWFNSLFRRNGTQS